MKRAVLRKRGDEVVVSFEYDRKLVDAIKSLPRRRFDPSTREWSIPLHLFLEALSVLEAAGASVELDGHLKAMREEGWVPPPQVPEVHVGRCGSEYVVQFEYDPRLVRVIKSFPGRSFDPASRAWFVPVEEGETLRSLLEAFEAAGCSVRLESKLKPSASL